MFLPFFTQVPPAGIILLVDLVLTVSRFFSFSFLYNDNKRFDFYFNWPVFFISRLPVSLLCYLWSNKSRKMKNSRTNFQWTRLLYCLATISVWAPLNSTCKWSVDMATRFPMIQWRNLVPRVSHVPASLAPGRRETERPWKRVRDLLGIESQRSSCTKNQRLQNEKRLVGISLLHLS